MALLWTMVDYRFVLLVVLVRAVTISSFKYINEPCSLFAKISTDLETKEGDTVEMRMVYCTLSHLENESLKFNFDISWAFNATTDINQYNLVYVSVVLWCISPFELDFINPHNMEKKNIVLALSLRGECKASVQGFFFVSFSGNDVDWVVNTLQRRLETHNPPYKLCIHHRDFEPGVPIVENIWKSLDQSKRMLVVLSSSYATSDWCLMEFRAAHRKVIEDRMKYLILILLEDVDTNQLDKEIQNYLRSNTYLTVKSKWFWQNLFYAMPFPTREITSERNQEHFAAIEEEREMACNTGDTVELV